MRGRNVEREMKKRTALAFRIDNTRNVGEQIARNDEGEFGAVGRSSDPSCPPHQPGEQIVGRAVKLIGVQRAGDRRLTHDFKLEMAARVYDRVSQNPEQQQKKAPRISPRRFSYSEVADTQAPAKQPWNFGLFFSENGIVIDVLVP